MITHQKLRDQRDAAAAHYRECYYAVEDCVRKAQAFWRDNIKDHEAYYQMRDSAQLNDKQMAVYPELAARLGEINAYLSAYYQQKKDLSQAHDQALVQALRLTGRFFGRLTKAIIDECPDNHLQIMNDNYQMALDYMKKQINSVSPPPWATNLLDACSYYDASAPLTGQFCKELGFKEPRLLAEVIEILSQNERDIENNHHHG